MALSPADVSIMAYANGFTLWHHKARKALQDVAEPGYFDALADMLSSGDMMMVSAPDGGRIVSLTVGRGSVAVAALV